MRAQVGVVGLSCRLPGAPSTAALWRVLERGECTVRDWPSDRWRPERFWHPRRTEPGFSYSFAGGYLDNPFSFDAAAFGISPREASQIDPQQRILLEVVWEALEDAGIPPPTLASKEVGVFVGASTIDYASGGLFDLPAIDSHFMAGNSLSIISNRISYVFDLRGPSFTVDSACSSSFVALAQAIAAIESGEIELAVVAGVNLLLSPAHFIGFSRAAMLSPTGLCRPFSSQGDGYVRSEGAVAMVLQRTADARANQNRLHAVLVGVGVNSDGRTNGISLPSSERQEFLIQRTYREAGVNPESRGVVEAHGTGTRVGDPAEAGAIGRGLAQARSRPLPIGSVKSNIGHLEPASGLAGLLKAILAIEHRILPRSLHLDELNPDIPFEKLGLAPAIEQISFSPADGVLHAGVCNYGFGGTNAHVILREATRDEQPLPEDCSPSAQPPHSATEARLLLLTAHSREALAALAGDYANLIAGGQYKPSIIASAVARKRARLPWRAAVAIRGAEEMVEALRSPSLESSTQLTTGVVSSNGPKIGFVYSGNGCQWPGMGRIAFARNRAFRGHFKKTNALFKPVAGWSLIEALYDSALVSRLRTTSVSQPLLFAIQSALTFALRDLGLQPAVALGHSVGEVAAAEASGALSLNQAVRLIYHRSEHQEVVRGMGRMAALMVGEEAVRTLLAEVGAPGVEIGAINSPSSTTITGPERSLLRVANAARRRHIDCVHLDLDYAFHSSLLDRARDETIASLDFLRPRDTESTTFVSTVSGEVQSGIGLNGTYWWNNIRQPVQFKKSVEVASRLGVDLFVEIGSRPILVASIMDTLRDAGLTGDAVPSFSTRDEVEIDPVLTTASRALVRGAPLKEDYVFGSPRGDRLSLPSYPWQRQRYELPESSENLNVYAGHYGRRPRHPLIGSRLAESTPEWRSLLDPVVVPYLADHVVDGEILMPAAGMVEMAIAAGRDELGPGPLTLQDFDIIRPLLLDAERMREIAVRHAGAIGQIEIWSRPRLANDQWVLHARGRVSIERTSNEPTKPEFPVLQLRRGRTQFADAKEVYAATSRAGLEYGPSFRSVLSVQHDGVTSDVQLAVPTPHMGAFQTAHILHPISFDGALQALFVSAHQTESEVKAHLPVRFKSVKVWRDSARVVRAIVTLQRETNRSKTISFALIDESGAVVATVEDALIRSVVLSRNDDSHRMFHTVFLPKSGAATEQRGLDAVRAAIASGLTAPISDAWLLVRAFAKSLAHHLVLGVSQSGSLSVRSPIESRRIANGSEPLLRALMVMLQSQGLATKADNGWTIKPNSGLPTPDTLLRTLIERYPAANVEILLASKALHSLSAALTKGRGVEFDLALVDQFQSESLIATAGLAIVRSALTALVSLYLPVRPRVLIAEPWTSGLLREATRFARQQSVDVILAGTDRALYQQVAARFDGDGVLRFVDTRTDAAELEQGVDLVLSMSLSPQLAVQPFAGQTIVGMMKKSAAMLIIHQVPDPTLDVLFGGSPTWFSSDGPGASRARALSLAATRRLLSQAGVVDLKTVTNAQSSFSLITGRAGKRQAPLAAPFSPVHVIARSNAADGRLASVLARHLADGPSPRASAPAAPSYRELLVKADSVSGQVQSDLVDLVDLPDTPRGEGKPKQLEDRLNWLVQHLNGLHGGSRRLRLWIVVRGAFGLGGPLSHSASDAIWAFGRAALNEYPALEIRLVDIDRSLRVEEAGRRLAALIRRPSLEREILLRPDQTDVIRVARGEKKLATMAGNEQRTVLKLGHSGTLKDLEWRIGERIRPRSGEIEVEIAATGLNFRDIMIAMGLIDEDILNGGSADPSLGFECAGVVSRVGANVHGLRSGDPVVGFGCEAFSSFITGPASSFFSAPVTVPLEAAATMPVAFVTAWYSLVEMARVRRGESVLIHGAAGGVGLAAMQIARLRGARILATAGSEGKRDLVTVLGAESVYDSRSLAFADQIRRDIGGVDVVLNSLAGDAMIASLELLNPSGRFVELGKRDYINNTHVALRPFVRNLSYFGVDLDQLLKRRRGLVKRIMSVVAKGFESGDFTPLPHRVFEADEAASAFRLMQSAGHVGKILIRPSRRGFVPRARSFRPGPGVHLVIGGTRGFGFETACWLAERGAKTVVVASRRGEITAEVADRVEAIRSAGVSFEVERVDVTDPKSVRALLRRIAKRGPVNGIIHSAMVLDDGLIAGLTPEKLHAVMAPKVEGVIALDATTRNQPLDYFVVYSSIATLIGNPGQAAYVAANGFVEGFMRKRRAEGRPGLAIGWGAISDAGVLVRNKQLAQSLVRTTGVAGISAHRALAHLGRLLASEQEIDPVQFYSDIRHTVAAHKLPMLRTPAFAEMFARESKEAPDEVKDIAETISAKSDVEARREVVDLVSGEIAKILRLEKESIDIHRPLSEIGVDSLMALEFRLEMERRCGVDLPLIGMTGGKTLSELADRIFEFLKARRNGDGLEPDDPERLLETADEDVLDMQASDAVEDGGNAGGIKVASRGGGRQDS
jgi:phthiocerol/phenolphthiocerol synthesis type-I polyketide synthase C